MYIKIVRGCRAQFYFKTMGDIQMDMENFMATAQQLQDKVAAAQAKLDKMSVKGISANGGCIVDMSGKYDLINLTIRPDVLSMDADAASKIIADAFRDAKAKADKLIDDVMGAATAGIQMPM
ncbi:MAG: YbaB/EbfC family nucleoid-associated protein [Alphaproteobacteria bacterium]|nr:YbaB/EbfC family nucleoid-associated protein [Alphaproteobacteria bacterium]